MDTAAPLHTVIAAGRHLHEAIESIDALLARRLGVHRSDLRCLLLLERGPATPGDVAAHTRLTSGSVTALVDRLEGAGFVERCRSATDRRCIELAMPPARLAELRLLNTEIEQAVQAHFGNRDAAEIAEAARLVTLLALVLSRCTSELGAGCG